MKKWYKYRLSCKEEERSLPKDTTFDDHKRSMMGYSCDKGYSSKEEFFKTHFYDAHPRHRYYHDYLTSHLKKGDDIFSVGSGRCVNELLLIEDGFNVTCSDLEQPCRNETMRLFPDIRFMEYDITKGPVAHKFDSVISLSMCYLFDEEDLSRVFKNISDNLKPGGTFILDPCGAEDNLGTRFIDDLLCPSEMILIKILKTLLHRDGRVITKKHHGYRTTDAEIAAIAGKAGLSLCDIKKYDYFTEFGMRSNIFGMLPRGFVEVFGRAVPYIRMFSFKKDR